MRYYENELENPVIASDEEFVAVMNVRKVWYASRDQLENGLKMAKENPYKLIKIHQFSNEKLELVETEERKFKTNLRNNIKRTISDHRDMQIYTRFEGNKFYGYIQYIPNRKRMATPIDQLFGSEEE